MSNQLNKITKQYRKFTKGQFVEHGQFNEFLTHFEDQERLSRTLLSGVGIVCGFAYKPLYNRGVLNGINISQGAGVTTDGDVLHLSNTSKVSKELGLGNLQTIDIANKEYTSFKAYDNYKVNYDAFYKEISGKDQQIELWELATAKETTDKHQPITELTNIEDKFLVLYLEGYEKEVKPCRGVDCDNHGTQQIANIKMLLTNKKGIQHIIDKDTVYKKEDTQKLYTSLSDIKLKRVVLEDKDVASNILKKKYTDIVQDVELYQKIEKEFGKIATHFGVPNEFDKNTVLNKKTSYGFQYEYDLIKDLIATYTEIKELLPLLSVSCMPSVGAFPKHLMLGKLLPEKGEKFRNQFYKSPILDDEQVEKRVALLINRFNTQVIASKSKFVTLSIAEIKITPSQQYQSLGNKAIPFYYKNNYDTLLKNWVFGKENREHTLGYEINSGVPVNLQQKSFFRIEGHQGKNYATAYETLKAQKEAQQLPFDIMLVSLAELNDSKDVFKASFKNYIKEHPGLEHKAGVQPGGTFVMVYESERSNAIIADFSLPYLCCTKKEKVGMSLPVSTICENDAPFPITIQPLNGVVNAFVKGRKLSVATKVIGLEGGQMMFYPGNVPDVYLGETMTFTVNGQPTEMELIVHAQTEVKVTVSAPVYDENKESATVDFEVSAINGGDLANITSYQWNFGDGTPNVNESPIDNIVTHDYNLLKTEKVKFTPKLTIINKNGCSTEVKIQDVTVENSIRTLQCDSRVGVDYKGKDIYSFLVDYKAGTGKAGITYSCVKGSVYKIDIVWNNKVFTNYIGSASSGVLYFNKDSATPTTAKVTITPHRSGEADCHINMACPVKETSYPFQIQAGKCGEKPTSEWTTVYMKQNRQPTLNDTVYLDSLFLTKYVSDKRTTYKIKHADGTIYNLGFSLGALSEITNIIDCTIPKKIQIVEINQLVAPECRDRGAGKTFKIINGESGKMVRFQLALSNESTIKSGGSVKIKGNTSPAFLLNETIAFGVASKINTYAMQFGASGEIEVELDLCASNYFSPTTAARGTVYETRGVSIIKAVFRLDNNNTGDANLSDQIVEVEAKNLYKHFVQTR